MSGIKIHCFVIGHLPDPHDTFQRPGTSTWLSLHLNLVPYLQKLQHQWERERAVI